MSFRKEIKYRLTNYEALGLISSLHQIGMRELYPSRKVKSIYFDNQILSMFTDSEEGILPRKKIRVRWYNEERKYSLETKISSLEGRFKTTEDFTSNLEGLLTTQIFDTNYGNLVPKLQVSYVRSYYSLDKLRITYDTEINYLSLQSSYPLVQKDGECVVEIKVPKDMPEDYIKKIIPYNEARFSKYARGLLMFHYQ